MSDAKLFLVSGGAGGIGAATCAALAAAGFMPVVGYHRAAAAADAVARQCGGLPLALDLNSETSIDRALAQLSSSESTLAGAVLAAAPPLVLAPFGKIAADAMHLEWQVHVAGPQRLLAGLVRHCWRPQKDGVVVGVLSQAMGDAMGDAPRAAAGLGAYVIGKYGLAGLLAVLAADYPWLRVRTVKPGYTDTAMLNAFDERYLAQQRERFRFRTPQEVAAEIVAEALRL